MMTIDRTTRRGQDIAPITWDQLYELANAIEQITGYASDNSCGDPDCCGGPFYEKKDFDRAEELLASYGLKWNGTTE